MHPEAKSLAQSPLEKSVSPQMLVLNILLQPHTKAASRRKMLCESQKRTKDVSQVGALKGRDLASSFH